MAYLFTIQSAQSTMQRKPLRLRYPAYMTLLSHIVGNLQHIQGEGYFQDGQAIPSNLGDEQTLVLTDNMDVFLSDAAKSQQLGFLYMRKQRDTMSKLVPEKVLATLESQEEAARWLIKQQLKPPADIILDERYSADFVTQIVNIAELYNLNVYLNGRRISQTQAHENLSMKPNFERCVWLRSEEADAGNQLYQPQTESLNEFDFILNVVRALNRAPIRSAEGSFIRNQQVEKLTVTQQNINFSAPPAVLIANTYPAQHQQIEQVRGLPSEIKEVPEPVSSGPSFVTPLPGHFLFLDIDPVICGHLEHYCLNNGHRYVRVDSDARLRDFLSRIEPDYHTVLLISKDQARQLNQHEDLLRRVKVVVSCFNPMGPSTEQINIRNKYNALLIGNKDQLCHHLDQGGFQMKIINRSQMFDTSAFPVRQMEDRPPGFQSINRSTILPPVAPPLPFVQALNSQIRPHEVRQISFVEPMDPSKNLMQLQYGQECNTGTMIVNTAPARMVDAHQLKPKQQRNFPDGVPIDSINSSNFPIIQTQQGKYDSIKQNGMESIQVPSVIKSDNKAENAEPVTQMSRIVKSHSARSGVNQSEEQIKPEQKVQSPEQVRAVSHKQESVKELSNKSSLKKVSAKSASQKQQSQKKQDTLQNNNTAPERLEGQPLGIEQLKDKEGMLAEIPTVPSITQQLPLSVQPTMEHPAVQTVEIEPIESGVSKLESNEKLENLSKQSGKQGKSSSSSKSNNKDQNLDLIPPTEVAQQPIENVEQPLRITPEPMSIMPQPVSSLPQQSALARLSQSQALELPKINSELQPLQPHSVPSSTSEIQFPAPIMLNTDPNIQLLGVGTASPANSQTHSTPQIPQRKLEPTNSYQSQNVLPTSYPIYGPLSSIPQKISSQGSRVVQPNIEQNIDNRGISQIKENPKTLQSLQPKSSTSLRLQEDEKLSGVASVSNVSPPSAVQPSSLANLSNQSSVEVIPIAQYGSGLQQYIKKRSESQTALQSPQPITLRKLYDDKQKRIDQPITSNAQYSQQPVPPHSIRTFPVSSPAIRQTLPNNFPMTHYPISQAKQTILLQYKYLDDFAKTQPVMPPPTHIYIFQTIHQLLQMLKGMPTDPSYGIVIKTIYSPEYNRLPLAPNVIIKKYLGSVQGPIIRTMSGRNKILSPHPVLSRWVLRDGRVSTEAQRYRSHETIMTKSQEGKNVIRYRLRSIQAQNGQNDEFQPGSPIDRVPNTPRRTILNRYMNKMFNRELVYILVNQKEQHLIENIHRQRYLNQRIRLQTYNPGEQKGLVAQLSKDNICILICRDEQVLENVKEFLQLPNFQILYLNKQRYVYANELQMENFFQLSKRGQVVRLIESIPRFYSTVRNRPVLDYDTISIYFESGIPKEYKARILSLAEREKSRIIPHQISNHHEVLKTADNCIEEMFIAVVSSVEMFNLLNGNRGNLKIYRVYADQEGLDKQLEQLGTLVEDQPDRRKSKTKIRTDNDSDDGFDRRLAAVEFKKFLKDGGDQDSQLWINREYYDSKLMQPEVVKTYVNHFNIKQLDRMPSGRVLRKIDKYQLNEYQQVAQPMPMQMTHQQISQQTITQQGMTHQTSQQLLHGYSQQMLQQTSGQMPISQQLSHQQSQMSQQSSRAIQQQFPQTFSHTFSQAIPSHIPQQTLHYQQQVPQIGSRTPNLANTFMKSQNNITVNKMEIQGKALDDMNKMSFARAAQQAIEGVKPVEVIKEVSEKNTKSKKSMNPLVTSQQTERSSKLKQARTPGQASQQPISKKSSSKNKMLTQNRQISSEKPELSLTGQKILPKDVQIQQKKSISIQDFDKQDDPYELNQQNKKDSRKEEGQSSKNANSSKKSSGLQHSRASSQKVASSNLIKRKSEKKLMRVPPLQDEFQDDSQHLSQSQFLGEQQRSDTSAPVVGHLPSSMKGSGQTKSNDKKQ